MDAEQKLGLANKKINEAIGRASMVSPAIRDLLIDASALIDDAMDDLGGAVHE